MRGGFSPRKQPTFHYATTGFPAKWRLRNEGKNSLRMKCHHPDLDSASDWLKQISRAARSIKSTTQIFVVTRRQYGIFARVSQTSFRGKTSGGVVKCRLLSQVRWLGSGLYNRNVPFHWARGISEISNRNFCWMESDPSERDVPIWIVFSFQWFKISERGMKATCWPFLWFCRLACLTTTTTKLYASLSMIKDNAWCP